MKPGEEKEIGACNGWRYVIRRSDRGGLFWVERRSMSLADWGRRCQVMGCYLSLEDAERQARKTLERSQKAVRAYEGW